MCRRSAKRSSSWFRHGGSGNNSGRRSERPARQLKRQVSSNSSLRFPNMQNCILFKKTLTRLGTTSTTSQKSSRATKTRNPWPESTFSLHYTYSGYSKTHSLLLTSRCARGNSAFPADQDMKVLPLPHRPQISHLRSGRNFNPLQRYTDSSIRCEAADHIPNRISDWGWHQHSSSCPGDLAQFVSKFWDYCFHCQSFLLRQCCAGPSWPRRHLHPPPPFPRTLLSNPWRHVLQRSACDWSVDGGYGAGWQCSILLCCAAGQWHSHFALLSRQDWLLVEGIGALLAGNAVGEGCADTKPQDFSTASLQELL